jgi:hypothetical protein
VRGAEPLRDERVRRLWRHGPAVLQRGRGRCLRQRSDLQRARCQRDIRLPGRGSASAYPRRRRELTRTTAADIPHLAHPRATSAR